jgi:hypothetical protein
MLADPLVIVHENPGESLGFNFAWRDSLAWADQMGALITKRAYSGFCLVVLASQAARGKDFGAIPVLLGRAFRRGAPTAMQIALFASFWLLPAGVKERLRSVISKAGAGRAVAAQESDAIC